MKLTRPIVKTAADPVIAGPTYGKTSVTTDQKNYGGKLKSAADAGANNVMPLAAHEILDRFELLYPDNDDLVDLRRAYIDKDLNSIFRLLGYTSVKGNADDLRRAVLEKNLHSIFRLMESEDLRKFILEDNMWRLWPLLKLYQDTHFIHAFKTFFRTNTIIDTDCFSRGQLRSKLWLIAELKKLNLELGTVFLCAGWYAVLAVMLFENNINLKKIRSFDMDISTVDIAEVFNIPWVADDWKFKAVHHDILEINYEGHIYNVKRTDGTSCKLHDVPDTIINTSCEHIENFKQWYDKIPNGKLLILQANDFLEVEEHSNCYGSITEFGIATPMSVVLFEGVLPLEKYNRFMRIGYK
jgi:hypothetical protein